MSTCHAVSDTKDRHGNWVKTYGTKDVRYITQSFSYWSGMHGRCFRKKTLRKKCYEGCSYSENFEDFQFFTDWCQTQIGYGQGYHLDKDILVTGNKEYHEAVCVFVPRGLNNFFCDKSARRGMYPQGVTKWKRRFKVQINYDAKNVYLGLYATPEEAGAVYKAAKEAEAYRWYERLRDGEFVVDPRVIERMRTWQHLEGEA